MKSTFIAQLKPGEFISDQFALRSIELKEYSGGKMIQLELVDKSGRIGGVIWNGTSEMMQDLLPGTICNLSGNVTLYRGKKQVTVESISIAPEYEPDDFLPTGPLTTDQLEKKLSESLAMIEDGHYRAVLETVFSDKALKSGFLRGVGGKLWHHNYIGGLAEHSLAIFDLCLDFASRYPYLDKNLLLAGAILHDIGKVESYSLDGAIDYTDSGRLLGHIVIGDRIVSEAIDKIPDFPAEKKLKLRHLVLSHQGSPEQASPVPPMMPEGVALYIADLLDSKLAAIQRISKRENRPGIRWSNYVNLLDRYIYFGNDGGEDAQENL